jgi:hypothetical protein
VQQGFHHPVQLNVIFRTQSIADYTSNARHVVCQRVRAESGDLVLASHPEMSVVTDGLNASGS